MRSQILKRFAIGAISLFALPLFAGNVTIDTAHTKVEFTVVHMMVSNVTGRFDKFEGTAVVDEKTSTISKINFKIQTASINTNQEKRDGHLRSADFFDADKNKEITFTTDKPVVLKKGQAVQLPGVLTLRGVSKPVTLSFVYRGSVKDPMGKTRYGFDGSLKINRKDFGVSWNKPMDGGGLVVSEEVTISLAGEAVGD